MRVFLALWIMGLGLLWQGCGLYRNATRQVENALVQSQDSCLESLRLVDLDRAAMDRRERILVQPGDVLILQEKPGEALTRYFTQTFLNFDVFWQVIHKRFATGVLDISAPDRLSSRVGVVNLGTPP